MDILEELIVQSATDNEVDKLKKLLKDNPLFDIHFDKAKLLIMSARSGALESVKYLISIGMDIHAENDNALRWAANNNYFNVVKYLVESGADIHAQSEESLRYSAFRGFSEIVEFLLANGANIKPYKQKILKSAIDNKHFNIFKIVVETCKKEEMSFIAESLEKLKSIIKENKLKNSNEIKELINWTEKYTNAKMLSEKLNNEMKQSETQRNRQKI